MRRLVLLPVLLALLAPASAHARAPRAVLLSCDRAHESATFEGRMDTVPSAVRLQMRFRLQVLTPDEPKWTAVKVPGFSAWVSSYPGRLRYVYTKRVQALPGPASYRVQVRFRWLDADGEVVRTARATSPACRQPDPRADLAVTQVDVRPAASPDMRRYAVTVRNRGRSTSDASDVLLELPDGTAVVALVGGLVPGQRETVVLRAPACAPGGVLWATADSGDEIDESDEDNTVSRPCA